jgi:hypothetical protein
MVELLAPLGRFLLHAAGLRSRYRFNEPNRDHSHLPGANLRERSAQSEAFSGRRCFKIAVRRTALGKTVFRGGLIQAVEKKFESNFGRCERIRSASARNLFFPDS